jgi:hypothetical protein
MLVLDRSFPRRNLTGTLAGRVRDAGLLVDTLISPAGLAAGSPSPPGVLEWHQVKLVGGMLIAALPFGPRSTAAQLTAMPPAGRP